MMRMNRRHFSLQLAALGATTALPVCATQLRGASREDWSDIETASGGRLGVAVLRASYEMKGSRLDERFPMCSTFKWLAAASVLHRVDASRTCEWMKRR